MKNNLKSSNTNEKRLKKEKYLGLFVGCCCLLIVVSATFALFTVSSNASKTQSVRAGKFDVTFTDGNTIVLDNATPVTDTVGMESKGYTFTVKNTWQAVNYLVALEEDETVPVDSRLTPSQIKYSIKEGDGSFSTPALLSTLSPTLIFFQNKTLSKNSSETFVLKLWVDEAVGNEGQNKTYKAKILVNATQTT